MEEQPENNGHYIRTSWRRPNPTVVNPPGGTSTPLSANINLGNYPLNGTRHAWKVALSRSGCNLRLYRKLASAK